MTVSLAPSSRQLPAETKLFSHVISMWREITSKVQNKLDALRITTSAGVLETLQNCSLHLERIMKSLEVTLAIPKWGPIVSSKCNVGVTETNPDVDFLYCGCRQCFRLLPTTGLMQTLSG